MNEYYLKASDLIKYLQVLINKHGDLNIYKTYNNESRPAHFIEYYKKENRFEIL